MVKGYVPKVCRDCRRRDRGLPTKIEWCDCGGEMRVITYGRRKYRKRPARG